MPTDKLTPADVFTLIGHAAWLVMDGQRDMPLYFYGLAKRIAVQIGDPIMAARCDDLAVLAQQEKPNA